MENLFIQRLYKGVVKVEDREVKDFLQRSRIYIAVHRSTFHADDVFSVALAKIYSPFIQGVHRIGRDEVKDYKDDTRFLKVDVCNSLFDHHDKNAIEKRPNGVEYASFGKIFDYVWQELGLNQKWAQKFDEEIVQSIDYTDNHGIDAAKTAGFDVAYSRIINSYNYEDVNSIENFRCFDEAVEIAKNILTKLLQKYLSMQRDEERVNEIIRSAKEKNTAIVILEKFYPSVLFKGSPIQFVIVKNESQWNVTSTDSGKYLVSENATEGRKFLHASKFMAAYDSMEHAKKAAIDSVSVVLK